MDAAEVRRFYDTVAVRYAELLPGLSAEEPLDLAVLHDFVRRVASTEQAVVVDAGCGTGRLLPLLRDGGLRPIGVDLSPGMLAVARDRHPDVRFAVGAVDALPLGDAEADGVLAWYSTIHTPPEELDAVLREFARVLRPGGTVLLAFQAGCGLRRIVRGYGTEAEVDAVLHDPKDVAGRARGAGLAVAAVLSRAAVRERHDQGFVLAQRP